MTEMITTSAQTEWEKAFSKLSTKQRVYVDARLSGLVPYASAKVAGYSDPEAGSYKLDKTPAVRDALHAASKVARVKIDMNRDDVILGLMDSLDACSNATEMTNVWKEIGKIIGAYQPLKVEITHDIGEVTAHRLMSMSNKELFDMSKRPDIMQAPQDEVLDAEYQVLRDAVTPPKPIDYDNDK